MYIMPRAMALIMAFALTQAVNAEGEAGMSGVETEAAAGALPPAYPAWPQQQTHKEDLPPPPPGPYMSTALAYAGQGFSCCPGRETEMDEEQQKNIHSPFFRNMPWPERRLPPQQWLPEGGEYTFAPADGIPPAPAQVKQYGYPGRPAWQPMYPPPASGRYR